MAEATQLNEDNFLEFVNTDELSAVFYYRNEDIYCERMKPIWAQVLADERLDKYKFKFAQVDVDEAPRCAVYAQTNGVVPAFVVYKRGQVLAGNHGPMNENVLAYRLAYVGASPVDQVFFGDEVQEEASLES